MIVPNWSEPVEIMCDASDFVIGVVVVIFRMHKCTHRKQAIKW